VTRPPDFTLERTDGRRVALTDFRGRPVVMHLTRAVSDSII
jgi:peroxiredoxin